MPSERLNMGWSTGVLPCYVLSADTFKQNQASCVELINKADAVIIGSAPAHLIRSRIRTNKLVFRYAERQLKKGLELWKYPYRFFKWHHEYGISNNAYLLSASAYAASDYDRFFLFRNRAYKWGYFPQTKYHDNINELIRHKDPHSIIWVARFIDWKHPEIAVQIAKRLRENGYCFQLKMIGVGVMLEPLRELIKHENLQDFVSLLGAITPEEVRRHMERSQIHLFTSDQQEGWGVVLNESMNSACAVIANQEIGSVPFLIEDGRNGLIYSNGNVEELYILTKHLLEDEEYCRMLGKNAYETITTVWNAELAAKRLLTLISEIQAEGRCDIFKTGPCSRDN